jgi:glutamate synthase domain-containing protein 3
MTGGIVVVLGETGQNFGAGMSAGVAYVLDMGGVFPNRCNTELVELQRIHNADETEALHTIIQWHRKKTRSWRAVQIIAEWSRMQRAFWRVLPRDLVENGQTTIPTACDYVDAHAYSAELLSISP